MPQRLELAGQRFGRWVVVDRAGRDRTGAALWSCVCDCGRISASRGTDLKAGKTNGCTTCARSFPSPNVYVDEVAVRRACYGDPVRLSIAERGAAVRAMDKAGLSGNEIARRLRLSRRTVVRYRQGQIKRARPLAEVAA